MEKDLALVEQFLDALWLEKNLAENTLSAYRRDLTMLVEWLARRELSLASAQSDDLQALLAERVEGGYKATSSARLLSAMRRLFQHLYREKIREDDPSALLASPKLPQRLPKDLSHRERFYISCSLGFSCRFSSFCGYKGKHRSWTGGTGSSISAGYDYCRWSCHPCA